MTEPYAPEYADVELIAAALSNASRCVHRDDWFTEARAVANKLSARLLPADAETRTEWTVKVNGNVMEAYAGITTEANCRAIAADPPFEGHEVIVVSRFAATGPWLPAPTEES